ncbi:hypothetical protein LJC16_02865 [Bacteroidales bacterium OttesenSCG-928-C19]|nr:hypothetical protein [Bacteroidales bacterium OttesenSCG-928-C19]
MENGEWEMGNGEWRMGNGKLRIENGKLRMGEVREVMEVSSLRQPPCTFYLAPCTSLYYAVTPHTMRGLLQAWSGPL